MDTKLERARPQAAREISPLHFGTMLGVLTEGDPNPVATVAGILHGAGLRTPRYVILGWLRGQGTYPGYLWPEVTNALAQHYDVDPLVFFTPEWEEAAWDADRYLRAHHRPIGARNAPFSTLFAAATKFLGLSTGDIAARLRSAGLACSRQQVWYWQRDKCPAAGLLTVPTIADTLRVPLGTLVPKWF